MSSKQDKVVYLRLRKRMSSRPGEKISLGAAARILTGSKELEARLGALTLYEHKREDGNRMVVDMLQIIRLIHTVEPDLTIEAYGEPQILIQITEKTRKPSIIMLIFAWLLLFFGAGLAIMNFHTDVSMKEVHIRLTELITGKRTEHPLWFQIPYSFGIGLGLLLFFNHMFRKRFNEEPNPLEVELHLYQENVDAYVIADELRKKVRDDETPAETVGNAP